MDGSLRELERRARSSGAAADVHAYLQALARSGAAAPGRAQLLAWLTDEPPPDARTLANELCAQGRDVIARGALAAAEALAEVWRGHAPAEHVAGPEEALAATRAWLACPCESHGADAAVTAEAALSAAREALEEAVMAVPVETAHDAPEDPCDLDALDAALTEDPRAAFEDVGDLELLARLRSACEAGEPVDPDLVEECRDRAGEEAVLEATAAASLDDGADVPDEPSGRRALDRAGAEELPLLDRQTVTLVLVSPVAELAAAAATACSARDPDALDELETLLGTSLERATSVWTVPDLDHDPEDDPLVLGAALIDPSALTSVVLDALRRWAIELPSVALPDVDPPATARRTRSAPRRRPRDEEELSGEPARLALLAWLGHPGAARRLGAPPAPADLDAWARGLASFGAAVCGRAALATARAAHDALEGASRLPSGPGRALATLGAWLERPGEAEAASAREALDRCVDAMCAAGTAHVAKAEELAALALELALVGDDRLGQSTAAVLVAGAEVLGPPAVRRAVARALAPALLAPEEP